MTKHNVTVTMPVEVTFVIDDTKVSDWDGLDLMHVHENGERWIGNEPIPQEDALASMAAQIIDRGGRLGGTDGYADFSDDAAECRWPQYMYRDADVIMEEVQ